MKHLLKQTGTNVLENAVNQMKEGEGVDMNELLKGVLGQEKERSTIEDETSGGEDKEEKAKEAGTELLKELLDSAD